MVLEITLASIITSIIIFACLMIKQDRSFIESPRLFVWLIMLSIIWPITLGLYLASSDKG